MRTWFWTRTCVFCDGQGRLLVVKEPPRERLYLLCEECETAWPDPQCSGDLKSALPPLAEGVRVQPASWEDLCRQGWSDDVAGSFHQR